MKNSCLLTTKILTLEAHSQVWDNFLATESTLKMLKNAFYFTLEALLVLKVFKFLSWIYSHVEKRPH